MLYFETPVGVGFSYNINRNYNGTFVGDEPAAIDNMLAIKDFFLQFPELKSLPSLRLAGESYAGTHGNKIPPNSHSLKVCTAPRAIRANVSAENS